MSDAQPRRPAAPVALVTGAVQGIGRAVAEALLADGMRVALLDLEADRVSGVQREIDPGGERTLALAADVGDVEQIGAALDVLEATWGWPDVLVNNAGRTVARPIWEISPEEWDAVLAVNLRSQLIFLQRCAPAMRSRRWGRIVNMSSIAGQRGGAVTGAHYAASKAGIIVVTKIAAADLAPDGVTVNAVAPAAVRTPAMDEMPAERVAALAASIPVGRVGEAEDVASAVVYLCSERAGFVTGATIDVNGGLLMR